jgi:hypothetical protein
VTPLVAALAVADIGVLAMGSAIGGAATLTLHAVLSVAAYALWLRGRRSPGFAPAILGVLGPAVLLVAARIAARVPPRAVPAVPLPEPPGRSGSGHRGASLAVARMLDGRVLHAQPDTLHSLVTVMRHGNVAERRRALETVVRSFQPALSPLIALALTDGDQTIRALAAAASARVVENLGVGRAALEAKLDDPEVRATLAAMLADHARGNVLLSDSQRAHLRDDALALLGDDTIDPARIERLWAAGDYAAIDALAPRLADGAPAEPIARAAAWWQAERAA